MNAVPKAYWPTLQSISFISVTHKASVFVKASRKLAITKALYYYITELIKAIKKFFDTSPCDQSHKTFLQ